MLRSLSPRSKTKLTKADREEFQKRSKTIFAVMLFVQGVAIALVVVAFLQFLD
jgi:preprotein translocase subunit SecY